MKAKALLQLLLVIAVIVGVGWLGRELLTYLFWERTMMGPFHGSVYEGTLSPNPTSVLKLSRGAQLELHNIPNESAPVLTLRRGSQIEWQQALISVKQYADGSVVTHSMRDVHLQKTVFCLHRGTKVRFDCFWSGGGREGGLIYLKPDQSLDHFNISW